MKTNNKLLLHSTLSNSTSPSSTSTPTPYPLQITTLKIISDLLTTICDENTTSHDINKSSSIKPFLSKSIPSISIKNFFERIFKYTRIDNSTLVLMLVYIDRLCDKQKFILTYFNIHKIIIASMMIAIKYNEDEYYNQHFYAKVGGVKIKEVQKLEYAILTLLNFELYVNETLFKKYDDYIRSISLIGDDEDELQKKLELMIE